MSARLCHRGLILQARRSGLSLSLPAISQSFRKFSKDGLSLNKVTRGILRAVVWRRHSP